MRWFFNVVVGDGKFSSSNDDVDVEMRSWATRQCDIVVQSSPTSISGVWHALDRLATAGNGDEDGYKDERTAPRPWRSTILASIQQAVKHCRPPTELTAQSCKDAGSKECHPDMKRTESLTGLKCAINDGYVPLGTFNSLR